MLAAPPQTPHARTVPRKPPAPTRFPHDSVPSPHCLVALSHSHCAALCGARLLPHCVLCCTWRLGRYHGEVCPGDWVYHSFDAPTGGNFQFHLVKHTGDLDIVVRHGTIPLKLVPPYTHVGHATYETDVQVYACTPARSHADPNERQALTIARALSLHRTRAYASLCLVA